MEVKQPGRIVFAPRCSAASQYQAVLRAQSAQALWLYGRAAGDAHPSLLHHPRHAHSPGSVSVARCWLPGIDAGHMHIGDSTCSGQRLVLSLLRAGGDRTDEQEPASDRGNRAASGSLRLQVISPLLCHTRRRDTGRAVFRAARLSFACPLFQVSRNGNGRGRTDASSSITSTTASESVMSMPTPTVIQERARTVFSQHVRASKSIPTMSKPPLRTSSSSASGTWVALLTSMRQEGASIRPAAAPTVCVASSASGDQPASRARAVCSRARALLPPTTEPVSQPLAAASQGATHRYCVPRVPATAWPSSASMPLACMRSATHKKLSVVMATGEHCWMVACTA